MVRTHRLLSVVLGAAIMAGCGSATPASSAPPTSSAAATSASASPSTAPTSSPSVSASAALTGSPFPVGEIPAGTWTASLFTPPFELTFPAGWTRGTADREVLVFRQGHVTVGVSHRNADVSAAALGAGATSTTVGTFTGFTIRQNQTPGTLWITEGNVPYNAPEGSGVQTWVLGLGSRAVTIDLIAPLAKLDASVASFLPILATINLAG